jgi:hypothetical protein
MKPSEYTRLFAMTILLVTSGLGGEAQGLQLAPGINCVVNGPTRLILHNASLINNGRFIADSGTVVFTGDTRTAGAFIGGANPVSFYNLTIGNSAKDLQLNSNTFVTGRITLDSGNLQLNDYTLDLGRSGSIEGERNVARITGIQGGNIRITAQLNGPHAVNPGNIGVEITSEVNLGSTVITRGHISQANSTGETGIQRWFNIVPETNTNLHASLRFFYLDDELVGKDKNTLTIFSDNEMDNIWTSWGKDTADAADNWIFKSNIDQLHRFTLAIGSGKANSMPGPSGSIPSLKIYPNPAHDAFALQMISKEEGNGVMYLYSQSGNLLEEKTANWQAGVNTIGWNISKYATGIYYLSIGGPIRSVIKIVRQ